MNSDYDVFDYDQSLFFRLLETPKFSFKFEFVQQKQGIIVCPLDLKQTHVNTLKKQNELIDTHLFLPSPYYKNHYIPLNSLMALASNNNNSNISDMITSADSFMLDHSPQIYLILNQMSDSSDQEQQLQPDLIIKYKRAQICTNVKLLSVQTAYTDNKKIYKILIVDKHLTFKQRASGGKPAILSERQYPNRLNGIPNEIDEESNDSSGGSGITGGGSQFYVDEKRDEYNSDTFEVNWPWLIYKKKNPL